MVAVPKVRKNNKFSSLLFIDKVKTLEDIVFKRIKSIDKQTKNDTDNKTLYYAIKLLLELIKLQQKQQIGNEVDFDNLLNDMHNTISINKTNEQ